MRREEFLAVYNEVLDKAKQIIVPKNQDYGADKDALRNFRLAEAIGGDAGRGIQYRMLDKMARAWTLHDHDPATKSETMEDTLLDLINYCVIYIAWMREEKRRRTPRARFLRALSAPIRWLRSLWDRITNRGEEIDDDQECRDDSAGDDGR